MKIFCVGLSRTGTLSLADALHILGYRVIHYPMNVLSCKDGKLFLQWEGMEKYDACADTPIARFYKQLDKRYPGSKFILTVRNEADWLGSCEKFFRTPAPEEAVNQLRSEIYSTAVFDQKKFGEAYHRHQQDVLAYFGGRKDDLCVLNICGGDGWSKLCRFLNKPVPDKPFPLSHRVNWDSPIEKKVKQVMKKTGLHSLTKSLKTYMKRKRGRLPGS